jgi:hypothetical protein
MPPLKVTKFEGRDIFKKILSEVGFWQVVFAKVKKPPQ